LIHPDAAAYETLRDGRSFVIDSGSFEVPTGGRGNHHDQGRSLDV
jgi:hypothetical protein